MAHNPRRQRIGAPHATQQLEVPPISPSGRSALPCQPPVCLFLNKLNHRCTNTGLGSTTSAPRGFDIKDKERQVRAGRSQSSRPSGHAITKEEAMPNQFENA